MVSPPDELRLLTVAQVADHLNCSPETVRRKIRDGLIDVIRDGRYVRVRPAAVEAYLRAHAGAGMT